MIFTARKQSLRRLCFDRCLSTEEGGLSLCPGVSVWGGSLSRGSLSRGGLCPGGLCLGVSVQGGCCPGGLCLGVFVSVRPPSDGNKRAVRIILECNLVKIEVLK